MLAYRRYSYCQKAALMKKLLIVPALLPLTAFAESVPTNNQVITFEIPATQSKPAGYTLQNSKAHRNPLPAPDTSTITPSGSGTHLTAGAMGETKQPRAYGSFGVPYTSKRVSLSPTSAVSPTDKGYLSATYPYRAIGKLTFNVDQSPTHCSASLIRRSVLVTAAHCVQDFGGGDTLFTNHQFIPATYNGSAPYGTWAVQAIARPRSWANGTDTGGDMMSASVNNDVAVMILNKNATDMFLGDITGYLTYGWNNYSFTKSKKTGDIWIASISTLGYPGMLDEGNIMQRTDGPAYLTEINGAGQIYQGSNLTGGSSGGPWIANFGFERPAFSGANAGLKAASNTVIGVTSWGTADPNQPKDNYSSQFQQNAEYPKADYGGFGGGNIGALLNAACSQRPTGSTKTYKQMGYCD